MIGVAVASFGQTKVIIHLDSLQSAVGTAYEPGVFYVPKTAGAQEDFLNNGIRQNAIRLNIIESALNNTSNLNDCIAFLDEVRDILQALSGKTDKLIFILDKMPAWLSSSSDGSPAEAPGWFVLNTKPPANYADWEAMVRRVVDRIINEYGITNAYFEIWNEPALGSWTGTKQEYFELFERTYDAIKSVSTTAPVGGPGTNHWGRNLDFDQPYGYLSNVVGDLSLVGELIDSTEAWGKALDFVTWHDFSLTHQTTQNATAYITQKYASLGLATPELMIGEWNTPSSIRDTPLQKSFFAKQLIEIAKTSIDNHMVAAWQDFEQSPEEFHNEYGLLTYGDIHKPVYKAILLADKVRGRRVFETSNAPVDLVASISGDTLNVLVTNYGLSPFLEAFNHTLFSGRFNASQIDSAGYINILAGDLSRLDSVYQELVTISNDNPVNVAINNAIPVYQHFDSLQLGNREIILDVQGVRGVNPGLSYTISATSNNAQFKYDSLRTEGLSQEGATRQITQDQSLLFSSVRLIDGQISFSMEPNAVRLFQFEMLLPTSTTSAYRAVDVLAYPNPTGGVVRIESVEAIGKVQMTNNSGKVLAIFELDENRKTISLAKYRPGVYYLTFVDLNRTIKVIRQ